MNKKERELRNLYGQGITGFINAKSTDEACLSLIPKIGQVFNFLENFETEAKKIFPYLRNVPGYADLKEPLDLYFECKTFEYCIKYAPKPSGCLWLKEYNAKKCLLTFEHQFGLDEKKILNIPFNNVEDFEKIKNKLKKHFYVYKSTRTDLVAFCNELNWLLPEFKNVLKFSELSPIIQMQVEKIMKNPIVHGHTLTHYLQYVVRLIVDKFRKGITVDDYFPFYTIVRSYNRQFQMEICIQRGNTFYKQKQKIDEEWFFKWRELYYKTRGKTYADQAHSSLLLPYYAIVQYFLINFLNPFENSKFFHLCKKCGKYYITETKRQSKFCSDKCRLAWHNHKRIKSGEAAAYKRQRINSGKATISYYG